MGYRIAYHEMPGFKSPETPHYSLSGRVTDSEGLPLSNAKVRFESNLTFESIPLSSTTVTDPDGTYYINVAWGSTQKPTVTKEGYSTYSEPEIILVNESNRIDFQLTRQFLSTPGFMFPIGICAIVLGCLMVVRKRYKI